MKKLILFIFTAMTTQIFAATYYVSTTGNDGNNGQTANTAWKTIYKACSTVPANAGHIISIGAGNYTENQTCIIPSGVTIQGAGRLTTIITCVQSPIFKTEGTSSITIKSLTIDGRNRAIEMGLFAKNVSNIELFDFKMDGFVEAIQLYISSNVKIHDFEGVNPAYCTAAAIGLIESATDIEIWNATVFQDINTPGKIVGSGPDQSKNPTAPWSLPRAKITRLKVHDITHSSPARGCWEVPGSPGNYPPGFSVELWHSELNEVELYNMTVRSGFSIQSNGFDYAQNAKSIHIHHVFFDLRDEYRFALEMSTHNMIVDHNYFNGGFYPLCDFGNGSNIRNSIVNHNVFENGQATALTVFTGGVNNFDFSNNTFVSNRTDALFSFDQTVVNLKIRNNIFVGTGGTITNFGASTNNAIRTNNLFNNVSVVGSPALTAAVQLNGTGAKANPYFTLKAGSPAIDAGVAIAGITDGFMGSAPDLGAFESGMPAWNVGPGAVVTGPAIFPIPSIIEAELAVLSGGVSTNTNHIGYSGTGFVDGYQAAGAKTTFNLSATTAADFAVKLSYANGSTNATSLSLYLNGIKIKQIVLASTGTWDTWATRTDTLAMKLGLNVLEYVFEATDGGHTNLDKIEVVKVLPVYPIPSTIEAEVAELSAGAKINKDHLNYSGSGFVDGYNIKGSKTLFRVNAANAGTYDFKLTYANSISASTLSIYVNGQKLKQTTLPVLASWDVWGIAIETIPLNTGSNTLEYVYDATDGGNVNLDKVDVTLNKVTGTEPEEWNNTINIYPNPSSSGFRISGMEDNVTNISILSMQGMNIKSNIESMQEFGKELSAGLYIVRFRNENGDFRVIKIVKK